MIKHAQSCPVSHQLIDENVVRLTAFFTVASLLVGWFFPLAWFFLLLDFVLRIKATHLSPLARISRYLMHKVFKFKPKTIDAKPKQFAAKIGLVFSLALTISIVLQLPYLGQLVLVLFLTAASLEAFLNFCLGCLVYQLLVDIGVIKLPKDPKTKRGLKS